ncbi:acyl-CoA synthetase [Streptomyces oceani]|uniref:Acyl-CoA synthetase n=1 Tax=Streptomyces oceani TaxID=1075402 RepID=A0A1E7JY82_9ACTN|nr:acyl-CoA synthetase [Streptomyces oceani]OEU96624.1 acyl-CoA synthetase [Streptomyces oceani]
MIPLFPALREPAPHVALRFGERALSYAELAGAAHAVAERVGSARRVAVWATPSLETSVAVVAALLTGVPAVPINPRIGGRELAHIVSDSTPDLVLAEAEAELPPELDGLPRTDVSAAPRTLSEPLPAEPAADTTALIIYTSGTTGPPKGVVISRTAIAHTLDDLADAWRWTAGDVLVHALPLFHVHGLVLGMLGPLRRGGRVHHVGRFDTGTVTAELAGEASMLFGVPTMYHRLAEAVGDDPPLRAALAGARLLVSGSAALPAYDHERLTRATGQRVIERYGMTETLMNTSVRLDDTAPAGTVGVPLPSVQLRLVDEEGAPGVPSDGASVGEIQVRGPAVFTEYLNRPDATRAAFAEGGWFRTGDVATRDAEGRVRIVGRKSTDLIKSGGYKIGAGEIENVLLELPEVGEAAVTGEADPDLGERVIAWIVPADPEHRPDEEVVAEHVAKQLAPHKRPREVRFRDRLPRNDMGKVLKRSLSDPT